MYLFAGLFVGVFLILTHFIFLENSGLGMHSISDEDNPMALGTNENNLTFPGSNDYSTSIINSSGVALFSGSTNLKDLAPVNYTSQEGKQRSFEDFVSEDNKVFLDLKRDALINKNVTRNVLEIPILKENFSNLSSAPPLNLSLASNGSVSYVVPRNATVFEGEELGSGIESTGFTAIISNQSCTLCHPPDVTIGVGHAHIVQMINNYMGIFNKDSHLIEKLATINDLYGLRNNDNTSDPYVLYDSSSDKWFSSVMLINESVNDTAILAAVSLTDDPNGEWNTFRFNVTNDRNKPYCPDRPVIGTSGDKVVISVNVVRPDTHQSCYNEGSAAGYQILVVDKNQMTSNSPNAVLNTTVFHGTGWITMIPAKNNEVNDVFLVSAGAQNSSSIKLLKIEDLYSNVRLLCSLHSFEDKTNTPPDAKQPNTSILIDTADSRILDASYQNGKIWLGFNDGCIPQGDDEPRSCFRLMQLNVANSSQYQGCNIREGVNARVIEDIDIGHDDTYYYRPALQTDNQGNLFVVFGYSSDSIYPSLAVLRIDADDAQFSNITSKLIKEGSRNTEAERQSLGDDIVCKRKSPTNTTETHPCSRYGDYFSAVPDPIDPSYVWIAGQYYENTTYSTYIAKVSSSER